MKREETTAFRGTQKIQHVKISRTDSYANALKNSTWQGIVSMILTIISFISLAATVYASYKQKGDAGILVGIAITLIFALCIATIILSLAGLHNQKKTRHFLEIRSLIVNVILIGGMVAVYLMGLSSLGF